MLEQPSRHCLSRGPRTVTGRALPEWAGRATKLFRRLGPGFRDCTRWRFRIRPRSSVSALTASEDLTEDPCPVGEGRGVGPGVAEPGPGTGGFGGEPFGARGNDDARGLAVAGQPAQVGAVGQGTRDALCNTAPGAGCAPGGQQQSALGCAGGGRPSTPRMPCHVGGPPGTTPCACRPTTGRPWCRQPTDRSPGPESCSAAICTRTRQRPCHPGDGVAGPFACCASWCGCAGASGTPHRPRPGPVHRPPRRHRCPRRLPRPHRCQHHRRGSARSAGSAPVRCHRGRR